MATSGSPEENLENVENSQTESPSNNSPEPSQSSTATAPPPSGSFSLHNRWLIIGGAGGGVVLLAVIAFVAFTLLADGGPPQPGSLLDMVPEDAVALGIYDFPTIIVDEDFMEAIDVSDVQITVGGDVEELVNVDQVSQRINMRTDPGSPLVILMKGGFVFEDIRDVLDDHSYEESPYRGYEVWAAANASGAFALLEESGYLISAPSEDAVEEALKTLYRGSGSLADAESGNEMKRILDKLGENPVVFASVTDSCTVRRCQGYGFAVTEYDIDGEELTAEVVMLFSSERAAEAAADDYDDVADFIRQTHGYDIADTESDGEFVLGIGTLEAILTSAPPRQAPPPAAQQAQPVRPQQPVPAAMRPGNSEYWVQASLLSLLLADSEFVTMMDVQVLQSEAYIGSYLVEDFGVDFGVDDVFKAPFQDADVLVTSVSENPSGLILIYKGSPEFVSRAREERGDNLQEGGFYQGYEVFHAPSNRAAFAFFEEAGYVISAVADDSRTRLEEFLDIYPSGGKDSLANPMDNDLRRILDEIGDAPFILLSRDIPLPWLHQLDL